MLSVNALKLLFAILALSLSAESHFVLENSREWQALNSDDEMYLPVKSSIPLGKDDTRAIENCLNYPVTKSPMQVTRGASITLPFRYKDTANHNGLCTATLHDASSGKLVAKLAKVQDCVADDVAITVTIPTDAACEACTVRVSVVAVHISVYQPEYYDSCVDLQLSGTATLVAKSSSLEDQDTNYGSGSIAPIESAVTAPTKDESYGYESPSSSSNGKNYDSNSTNENKSSKRKESRKRKSKGRAGTRSNGKSKKLRDSPVELRSSNREFQGSRDSRSFANSIPVESQHRIDVIAKRLLSAIKRHCYSRIMALLKDSRSDETTY